MRIIGQYKYLYQEHIFWSNSENGTERERERDRARENESEGNGENGTNRESENESERTSRITTIVINYADEKLQ